MIELNYLCDNEKCGCKLVFIEKLEDNTFLHQCTSCGMKYIFDICYPVVYRNFVSEVCQRIYLSGILRRDRYVSIYKSLSNCISNFVGKKM